MIRILVLVIVVGTLAFSVAARVGDVSLHDVFNSIQQDAKDKPAEVTPVPAPTFPPVISTPVCEFLDKTCFDNLRPRTQ